MAIGLIVPVFKNFPGFADLIESIDVPVHPIIIPNWRGNIGVSKGWNAGIQKAIDLGLSEALIVGDDVIFRPGTLQKMIESFWMCDLITATNERDGEVATEESYVDAPDYSCFMIRPKEFVRRAGWFDENFSPAYFEDNDMAYRLKLEGMKQLRRLDATMLHKGSVTQNWEGAPYVSGSMFEKNRYYYKAKWGGGPGEETFTNPFDDDRISPRDRLELK